jgi:hypothetical protein
MVSFSQRRKGRDEKLTTCVAKGGPYSAISALVNIPATMLGVIMYEFFIVDSDRGKKSSVVPKKSGS